MFCILKKKKCPAYISKLINSIPLMIPNEEKEGWHYLAVKKISTLSREIMSKDHIYIH